MYLHVSANKNCKVVLLMLNNIPKDERITPIVLCTIKQVINIQFFQFAISKLRKTKIKIFSSGFILYYLYSIILLMFKTHALLVDLKHRIYLGWPKDV